jgi:outer membrane protein assembly factor BamA
VVLATAAALPSALADGKEPRPNRYEFGGTPVLTGDSDIGFGFGALASLARFKTGYSPYRWRAEALVMMTVKAAPGGGAELPYHDYYLKLDLPGLLGGKLRLNLRLSFGRFTNSGYYGMGNSSPALDDRDSRYHQYDRIYPQARARARLKVLSSLSLLLGSTLTYNWINHYQPSRLLDDLASGDGQVRDLLGGTDNHLLAELDLGWIWDTRNHEITPTRGVFSELTWRFAPGTASVDDLAYGGVNFTVRLYRAVAGERLVLAGRVMVDLLLGQPPFYELASHGGLSPGSSIGGSAAIRGVPRHRYHGKIKLLGNLELRSKLVPFTLWGQRFNLGATLFADTGRTWADFSASKRLDGSGAGLKVGLGGGPRFQWGETFLLRADVAWSPDARPIGIYIDVNHAF